MTEAANITDTKSQNLEKAIAPLRDRFPGLFSNFTVDSFGEYSCIAVAMMRFSAFMIAGEICEDRLSGDICGEEGVAMWKALGSRHVFGSPEYPAFLGLRTYCADHAMKLRHPSIRQIVMLGAGIDTRSFRLPELAGCHVFEIDGSKLIQDFKQHRIDELKVPLLAANRDVIIMNLADQTWPDRLLEVGFNPDVPTFWLVEGLLIYLTQEQIDALFTTIDSLSAPNSELFCNASGGGESFQNTMPSATRLRKFGEDKGLLRALPWTNDVMLRRSVELEYSGSLWDATKLQPFAIANKEDGQLGGFFFSWLKKSTE